MRSKPFGPVRGMLGARRRTLGADPCGVSALQDPGGRGGERCLLRRQARLHGAARHRLFGDVDDGRRRVLSRAGLLLARRDHAAACHKPRRGRRAALEGSPGQCARRATRSRSCAAEPRSSIARSAAQAGRSARDYPFREVLAPQTWHLLEAVKAALDPQGPDESRLARAALPLSTPERLNCHGLHHHGKDPRARRGPAGGQGRRRGHGQARLRDRLRFPRLHRRLSSSR